MGEHPTAGPRGPYGVPACRRGWDSVDTLLDGWSRERPDLDFTPVGVVARLAKVRAHQEADVTSVFTAHGLSSADFQVIVTLRRLGAPCQMPQARLMDALELTSGTVSVRLDRLESNGVVVREPDPANARGTLVRLTAKGADLFDVVAPQHLANEDRMLSALSAGERESLADLLRRLLSSYEGSHRAVAAHLGLQLESAPVARRRRQAVGLSDAAGLLVSAVRAGSAAGRAGLARGDLILEVDGAPTRSTVALAELLDDVADGQRLRFTVLRGDESRRIDIDGVSVPEPDSETAVPQGPPSRRAPRRRPRRLTAETADRPDG